MFYWLHKIGSNGHQPGIADFMDMCHHLTIKVEIEFGRLSTSEAFPSIHK
jgi:hypothetical protein